MLKVAEQRRLTNLVQQRLKERPEVRPFPAAVTQLLAACQDPNSTAATFEEIIECDPALAVRLLRMANSSLYGLANKVVSVGHATVVLGIRQLRSLALSVAGAGMFSEGATAAKERLALWDHSMGCATIARLLSKSIPNVSPEDAFLGGIVHDVGKLLLFDVVPDEYAQLVRSYAGEKLVQEEQFAFGITHEGIGLVSAHAWGLSEEIKATIGFHHRPGESPVHFEHAALIYVASMLARAWGLGSVASEDCDLSAEVLERLGLDDESLAALQDQAREMFDEAVSAWVA